MDTAELLAERGKTHGDYAHHALATSLIKDVISDHCRDRCLRGQKPLSPMQRESLDMIAHKIGRILAGNADFHDHWDDIAGYAKLVADRVRPPAPEETGCADDCVHPSHRHVPRYDEQNEIPTQAWGHSIWGRSIWCHGCGAYHTGDCPEGNRNTAPKNGADALGWNKPPCHCPEGFCMAEQSAPPKYVYCRKAEGGGIGVMWSEPTPKHPCTCGVDCYTKATGMALPAGTVCRKAEQ